MTDHITAALLSKVANTLENNTGINIIFRESPTFNFSKELQNAISNNNIYQDIVGDRQAMVLAIYKRSGIITTDKGIRHRILKDYKFLSSTDEKYGVEKRFVTADWDIQCRVSCSIKDIMEAIELNYAYWLRPVADTYIALKIQDVKDPIRFNYTTVWSDDTGLDYAEYGQYGPLYILSFNIHVTGDLLLPQSKLYSKILKQTENYYVGKENDMQKFAIHEKVYTYTDNKQFVVSNSYKSTM